MPICDQCGGQIEFRYMDGRPTPIHVNGGWCPGSRMTGGGGRTSSSAPFRSVESYVDPNALCPICGASVFYYQSPTGGRLFFDALGWPWPKHPCTDKPAAQSRAVISPRHKIGSGKTLRGADGRTLDVYEIDTMRRVPAGWNIKFRRLRDPAVFWVHLNDAKLKLEKLKESDLRNAPSFIVAASVKGHPTRVAQFICARLRKVVSLELSKITVPIDRPAG